MYRIDSPKISEARTPPVSIVIPIYNEDHHLPETISKLREINYPNNKLQIILSYERSSTDQSRQIAKNAAEGSEVFEVLKHDSPLGGKAKNVNYALNHTSGEIIGIIDADMRVEDDLIRRVVGWFSTKPDLSCLRGQTYAYNSDDSVLALHAAVERDLVEIADVYARELIGGFKLYGGGHAFFRQSVFERIGKLDETVLIDDLEMSARLFISDEEMKIDPNIVTYGENPPTFAGWWQQRKRWYLGLIQVAKKYTKISVLTQSSNLWGGVDLLITLSYWTAPLIILPLTPILFIGVIQSTTIIFTKMNIVSIILLLYILPFVIIYTIYIRDIVGGRTHSIKKFFVPITFWPYMFIELTIWLHTFVELVVEKK